MLGGYAMKGLWKVIGEIMAIIMMLTAAVGSPMLTAEAMTIYESDGCSHAEGYIFIGECHSHLASLAMAEKVQEDGTVPGLWDVAYFFRQDWSLSEGDNGEANTMYMKGNLFFVYESVWRLDESKIQTSKEYIYSDGMGNRGRGVERIHEVIDKNPNISHWNIIAYQGAVAVAQNGPEVGGYYADSYRNWIQYEFPEADIYFLSMSTMTKNYRGLRNKDAINNALSKAFPDKYLDYTDFFSERFPDGMLTPTDTLHWNYQTYQELVVDIIQRIQRNRGIDPRGPLEYSVTETDAVLYTNDLTVIYSEPALDREILYSEVQPGLPVHVTGVTDTGFFRIDLGRGITAYVHGIGLSTTVD